MRTLLLIPILLLLSFTSFSQEKIVDIEVPVASEGMFVIPLDTSGFFAIEKTGIVATNQMVKKGYHYNKNFELVNSFFIEMDNRFGLMRFTSDATGAYFLYKKTLNKNELGVMHISPDGVIDFTTVPLDQDFVVQQFQIAGGNALVGGLLQFEPVYFLFDLEQGRLLTLPGFQNNSRTIIQSIVDDRNQIITLVTSSENKSTGQLSYDIRNYSFRGELLRDVFINPEGGRNLISAFVSNFIGDSQFIYGAYVEPKMQGITGIYSVELKPAGEQEMIFTPFFQLPELYSHMPKNKAEGIIERAKKRFAKKGKWSTSERPQLYVPKLSANHILYAFEMDMDAHENLYQIVMSKENEILNTANTELVQNNVNRYTNQNPINFVRKSNAYRVLKSGVTWEHNGKFHFAYRNGDEIHANIIDAESSEFTKHSIAQISDAKVFRNLEEKIFPWYGDKVLVATEESRPGNGVDKNRHMVITQVTVH